MINKIIFLVTTMTIAVNAFTIPSLKSNNTVKKEVNELNSTLIIKKTLKKIDLSNKIRSENWFSWLDELNKTKDIDKINKKKIKAGAEIIAERVSIQRAQKINNEIGEDNLNWEAHDNNWKVEEQEETMKAIATKLSGMTLSEIIDIYTEYSKKEKI